MYDIFTSMSSPVATWKMCESAYSVRLGFDREYANRYPNATQIITYDGLSSTRTFNCHGYAWLKTEGGPDRWIGYYAGNRDPDIYISDGSYMQVAQPTYPCKVFWGRPGDHSAVTNAQGKFVSKWNEFPLMVHEPNYSPYGSSNLKYYIKNSPPVITGPNIVYTTPITFTLNNDFIGNWSVTNGFQITTSSTNVNSVTVKPTRYQGQSGTLTAVVNGVSVTKQIYTYVNVVNGPDDFCPSGTFYTSRGDAATWSVSSGFSVSSGPSSSGTVVRTSPSARSGTVTATINGVSMSKDFNGCPDISGPTGFCGWETYTLAIPGASATSWEVHPSQFFEIIYSDATTAIVNDYAMTASGISGTLIAMVNGQAYFKPFVVTCGGAKGSPAQVSPVSVYPNPTGGTLYIDIDVAAAQDKLPPIVRNNLAFDVRLYDGYGAMLRNAKTNGGKIEFNVENLPNGTYYLHIYDGVSSKPEMQQIIVQH